MPMDPFAEVSKDDLPKLRDIFNANRPYGVVGYCLLKTQISQPILSDIFNFKFYNLRSNISHGMVAVSDKRQYIVYICPTSVESTLSIEHSLANSNIIDWNRVVKVASANTDVLDCLERLLEKLTLKFTYKKRLRKYLLDQNSKPFIDMHPPENTYVEPLKPEFLNLVNRTWTYYTGEESYENIKNMMENGLTYVLYSSEDNRPVSWILVDNDGAFAHMYCLGIHRRKGYAEYITKVAINNLLSQGKDVLAYTLEENFKPQNLFSKLGFEDLGYVWWLCLTKEK